MTGPMSEKDRAEFDACFAEPAPPARIARFVIFDPLTLPRAFYSRKVAHDAGAAHAWSTDMAKATEFPSKADALAYAEVQLRGTKVAVMEQGR